MATKFLPHLHIIPEDDANRQMALALLLGLGIDTARFKLFPTARGWQHVVESFEFDHLSGMRQFPKRFMVLLVDFDMDDHRLEYVKSKIPAELVDRVFIFGPWDEAEDLQPHFGSFDDIGSALAKDCREQTSVAWGHEMLQNNASELQRFQAIVCPLIF